MRLMRIIFLLDKNKHGLLYILIRLIHYDLLLKKFNIKGRGEFA